MSYEEKKYLKITGKMRPSFDVFNKMAKILKGEQEKVNELFLAIDNSLLKTYKTI